MTEKAASGLGPAIFSRHAQSMIRAVMSVSRAIALIPSYAATVHTGVRYRAMDMLGAGGKFGCFTPIIPRAVESLRTNMPIGSIVTYFIFHAGKRLADAPFAILREGVAWVGPITD